MTKDQKAQKVLDYLDDYKGDWVTYDSSPRGKIEFIIKGMNKRVSIWSDQNFTDSYRKVANAVVDAGFDYGNCKEIITSEKKEVERRRESMDELNNLFRDAIPVAEKIRVNNLTEEEKLQEILERYGIEVLTHNSQRAN